MPLRARVQVLDLANRQRDEYVGSQLERKEFDRSAKPLYNVKRVHMHSSISSSRLKFSLNPVNPMVIFDIVHPLHTFNPQSGPHLT